MPKRTTKAEAARWSLPAATADEASRSDAIPVEELAWHDPAYREQLLKELAEGRAAARLLGKMGTDQQPLITETNGIVAHELRQPLFAIAVASENLRLLLQHDDLDRETMQGSVARIAEQVQRAQAIMEQVLLRSSTEGLTQTTDVAQAVRRAVALLDSMAGELDVVFACHLPEQPLVAGLAAIELEQVFVNLIRNALDSIGERRSAGWPEQGRIMITLQQFAGDVRCVVSDNGLGLPDAGADVLFEPFFTTKAHGGTGLGLHICRKVLGIVGGTIQSRSAQSGGAEFEIRMPLVGREARH